MINVIENGYLSIEFGYIIIGIGYSKIWFTLIIQTKFKRAFTKGEL